MNGLIKKTGIVLVALIMMAVLNVGVVFADTNYAEKTYTLTDEFNLGTPINVVTTNDEVKLDDTTTPLNIIWVAVSTKGTIVKIDTQTGDVLGEFKTAPAGQPADPSRTTVDKNGSVWVANRAGHSVTRVCTPESGLWVDRNGNGVCDTSTGLGDVRAWPGIDATTAEDECIINYVLVSSSGTRHVSVDANNDVWVSGIGSRVFNLIDGDTGAILRTEGPFGAGGYGGLIDNDNVIWSESSGNLLRWDTVNGTFTTYSGCGYGLAIDSQGNVWNSGYGCGLIRKFAPDGTLLGTFSQGYGYAQGCVAGLDDDIWVAHSLTGSSSVGHLKNDGTYVGTVQVPAGPTGVAVDAEGFIWATCYSGRVAVKIDPNAGPIGTDGVTPVGAVVDQTVDLGGNLYNYSDMTGSTLQGAPNMGTWSVVFDSGIADAKWGYVDWNDVITGNGEINVTVASSGDGVTFSPLSSVTKGVDVTIPDGQYIKVVVNLKRADTGETPILLDLTVKTENSPPDCSNAAASAATLWPPNNKYVGVDILGVTDPDAGDVVTIQIDSVTSDEPTATIEGAGGKVNAPDAEIVDGDTVKLRAERSGTGDGRVYIIYFTATDKAGATCTGSVSVSVPHDVNDIAIDSRGTSYDATVNN